MKKLLFFVLFLASCGMTTLVDAPSAFNKQFYFNCKNKTYDECIIGKDNALKEANENIKLIYTKK